MIWFKQTGEYFSDIYAAREAVLSFAKNVITEKREKAELIFDGDEYVLPKPLIFDAHADPAFARISLSLSCEDGVASFTSEQKLDPLCFQKEGEAYVYRFERDENGEFPRVRDLYINGTRIPICRSESFVHAFTFEPNKERLCEENLQGIYVPEDVLSCLPDADFDSMELKIYLEWEFFVLHVMSVDPSRVKYDENGKKHVLLKIKEDELYEYVKGVNRCLQPKNREFFFMNHIAFLTENSFCYDRHTGVLAYRPEGELEGELSVARLDKLLSFVDMDGITLENLEFHGVSDQYICDHGFLSHQANIEKRLQKKVETAAVFMRDVRGLVAKNCKFYSMNTNGILMIGVCARICITDCHFEDIGMSAISIGDPIRVGQHPLVCGYDIVVDNNFLRRIGFDFPSAPAIDIFRVDGLSVCHNTIEYCAYSGISCGWEWGLQPYALGEMINIRDAEIAYNRISHHMQILNDGGAIYVVGSNSRKENRRYINFMHDNFAYRDKPRRTVRGYYLDGSSTNWRVYDNVTSGTHRPLFAQFVVPEQYTWNNILENNYSTDEVHVENHAPERNTILGDVFYAPTLDELFEKYPKSKEIFKKSGCLTRTEG